MLIEQDSNILREARFNENLCNTENNPQPWQFKTFYDSATSGVEFIWLYDTCEIPQIANELKYELVSKDLFAITFPTYIKTQENYNLFVFPHHTYYLSDSNHPLPVNQIIETDWWTNKIRIIFKNKTTVFEKHKPFAQAIVIPKRNDSLKQLSDEDKNDILRKEKFINENQDLFITRKIKVDGYSEQDNLYERLSEMNKNHQLPKELKEVKPLCQSKLMWKLDSI